VLTRFSEETHMLYYWSSNETGRTKSRFLPERGKRTSHLCL